MKNRLIPAWLWWTLTALVLWGIWAVLSKLPAGTLTAWQIQALSTLGLLPMVPLLRRSIFCGASKRGLMLALAGGIVTCLGNAAYYRALALGGPVTTVVSLTALYPVVTVVLAILILHERLNVIQLAGIGLSLAAIWLFNIPSSGAGGGMWSPDVRHAIPPILLWGLSGFLQKAATNHVSGGAAATVYLASFVPVGIILAFIDPWPDQIAFSVTLTVMAVGFFLAFGNFAMLVAYARGGKAAVITPLGGLYPLVSIPAAVLFLNERPGPREYLGIAIALISIVALSWERAPAKNPDPPASV